MEGESGVTRSIIDELHCSDIHGEEMEAESGATGSIIHELRSSDIQLDEMECERMVLFEVSSMNLNPVHRMSKEIKWKMKMVLLELSLMNFILRI